MSQGILSTVSSGLASRFHRLVGTPPDQAHAPIRYYNAQGDTVEHTEVPDLAASKKFEKSYRLLNDVVVLLGLSDGPSVLSVLGTANMLPHSWDPVMPAINAINAATGFIGIAADYRMAHDCQKSEKATPRDKAIDKLHLLSDAGNALSGLMPLVTTIAGPVLWTLFAGGQLIPVVCDLAKTARDIRVGGDQSAQANPSDPHHMILDRMETRLKNWTQMAAAVGLASVVSPHGPAAIPFKFAQPLILVGASFGIVGAANDFKKASDLGQLLTKLKAEGIDSLDLPSYEKDGVHYTRVRVDDAVKANTTRKWLALGHGVTSGLMIAAAVANLPALGIAAIVAGGLTAAGTIGVAVHKNRAAIQAQAHQWMDKILHRHSDKPVEEAVATEQPALETKTAETSVPA